MKLVIYSINYTPELTGIGKYSGEMASWLVAHDHEVRVVTAPPYYPNWEVRDGYSSWCYKGEDIAGVSVWRCPVYVPVKPTAMKRIIHLASFALASIPVMVRQIFWSPDVVLVIEPPLFCAPVALVISKLSKAKSWLHVQDFEVDAAFDLRLLSSAWLQHIVLSVERWLMRRFDVVSTISKRMMEKVEQKGVLRDRCRIFINWADTEQIYPLDKPSNFRQILNIDANEVVALYSGNMGVKQGLEIVIDAARLLANEKIKFIMCGEGAAKNSLLSSTQGFKNIIWLPLQPIEKLNDLLNMADIHLLPQRGDVADLVMPSKLTGMLASGRPVVATAEKWTQIDDVLKRCGIIVEPGNAKQFSEAIKKLADSYDLRIQLGREARKYALENFNRDAVLSKFEKSLLKLVNGQLMEE